MLPPMAAERLECLEDTTRLELIERDRALKLYGDRAVGVIELYNRWARDENRAAGFE